jgi:hypothetical protein
MNRNDAREVLGAERGAPPWFGYVLAGSIAATFAVAFYIDANQPKPAPVRPPRYPRLPIP